MMVFLLAIVVGIAVLAHVAPFPFLLEAAYGELSVWRMPQAAGRRAVYLTYDDGPNPETTPLLLDLLKERGVRATFFVIERHVTSETAPIVRRMFREGHSVGLHSADRRLMLQPAGEIEKVLREAAASIESRTGYRLCAFFRPHAGWRSITMLRALKRSKRRLAGWSWKTWDWTGFDRRTGEKVAAQIAAHAAPGKIIVIHDGHHIDPRADRRYAVEATRSIIDALCARGFEFEPMCPPSSTVPADDASNNRAP